MYSHMYSTIHHADDVVLSSKQRSKYTKLKVSEKTKGLCGKDTKKQFKSVQSEIVKSSLSDFEACVEEWVNAISAANRLGDTCKVYKAVEVLAEKQDTPPINITTDNKGKLLSHKCGGSHYSPGKISIGQIRDNQQKPRRKSASGNH